MTLNDEIIKADICPECGSQCLTFLELGECTCPECGLVLRERIIDPGQDWRAFDQNEIEKRARTGPPSSYRVHNNLSTLIDKKNADFSGRKLRPKARFLFYRLRKWQYRCGIIKSSDRNLLIALNELDRVGSVLRLSKSVRETAAKIYRNALEGDLIRGRTIEGVVAASIYCACRLQGIPASLDEVALESKIDRTDLGRYARVIINTLDLKLMPGDPANYVSQYVSELSLSNNVEKKALELLKESKKKGIFRGCSPTGVAGAAIYIASIICDEKVIQKAVAKEAGVTEVTIRNHYKNFKDLLGYDF